jgi:hypothetical protein
MEPTAHTNAQFGKASDPGGIARDIADFAALTGLEKFQWQEIEVHGKITAGEIVETQSQYSGGCDGVKHAEKEDARWHVHWDFGQVCRLLLTSCTMRR